MVGSTKRSSQNGLYRLTLYFTKRVADAIRAKVSARPKQLKLTMFSCTHNLHLQNISAEPVFELLQAVLASANYTDEAPRVSNIFCTSSTYGQSLVASMSAKQFSPTVLSSIPQDALAMLRISCTSALEV